jgi:hypothetical protein
MREDVDPITLPNGKWGFPGPNGTIAGAPGDGGFNYLRTGTAAAR